MWYKYPEEDDVMRMLLIYGLLTVVLGLAPIVALGDDSSHRTAAENLLIVMEVDKSMQPLAEHVLENQLQHNPQLAPQRETLQLFLTKYLSWASVRQETITAYTQAFTEPELKQLTEFCRVEPVVTHPALPQTRTCAINACGSSGRASATHLYCPGGVW